MKVMPAYLLTPISVVLDPSKPEEAISIPKDTKVLVNLDLMVAYFEHYQIILQAGDYSLLN